MLEVKLQHYSDLSDKEKENVSDNGSGKEYADYIRILHNGETILLESDAMEPEDTMFCRDLNWIIEALRDCYKLGKEDALLNQ